MVIMLLIKVEKKKTIARSISSLKNVNIRDHITRLLIAISFQSNTHKKSADCEKIISATVAENQKNFPIIKSCLLIGFERIRKIVFPSTSLKRSWLPTKRTPIRPKISIIPSPKSTITFSASPIVSFPRAREKIINTNAKKSIR